MSRSWKSHSATLPIVNSVNRASRFFLVKPTPLCIHIITALSAKPLTMRVAVAGLIGVACVKEAEKSALGTLVAA
jgi:hypothetical protein